MFLRIQNIIDFQTLISGFQERRWTELSECKSIGLFGIVILVIHD